MQHAMDCTKDVLQRTLADLKWRVQRPVSAMSELAVNVPASQKLKGEQTVCKG